MTLSTKLQAEYSELAHQYLDNIPVENEQDFEIIAEALKSITEPTTFHTVPPSLEGRIKGIKEIIDQPELYVQQSEHYDKFKNIILQRVISKIKEIQALSPIEKEKYIADQKKLKETAMQNQTLMTTHQPPLSDSEAHVISEQEWLQQQQQQFQQQNTNVQTSQQLSQLPSLEEINQRLVQVRMQLEQYQAQPPTVEQMLNVHRELNVIVNLEQQIADLQRNLISISIQDLL